MSVRADRIALNPIQWANVKADPSDPDSDDWQFTPETYRAWEQQSTDTGEQRHVLALEDTRTGQLVAYTIALWFAERAAVIRQCDTGVHPDYRGQGLAKWLKAAMLDLVRIRCPGAAYVQTGNAEGNSAMLAINEALGFRPWMCAKDWKYRLP